MSEVRLFTDEITALQLEVQQLKQQLEQLKQEKSDLQITLMNIAEHGDTIQAELSHVNNKLKTEINERRKSEFALKALLDIVSEQRNDLEIIIDTIIQHGDILDLQWDNKVRDTKLLATVDGLTGISNRRKFDEYLDQQWRDMAREKLSLSLLLCDIDHFKEYNDTYGHLAGDDCLRQVSHAIQTALKRPLDLVARYGGEEFAVILPKTCGIGAIAVTQRIQTHMHQMQIPHCRSTVSPYVTISIGAATMNPIHTESPEIIIQEADRLLYRAKEQGRNLIVHAFRPITVVKDKQGG